MYNKNKCVLIRSVIMCTDNSNTDVMKETKGM